jgi:hypothetical protein
MSLFNFGQLTASDREDFINGLSMWAGQLAALGTADNTVDADPKPDSGPRADPTPAAAVNFSLTDHAKKAES